MELDALSQAAIILMSLPPELSAQLFKELGPEEVQRITLSLSKLPQISAELRARVVADFLQKLARENQAFVAETLRSTLPDAPASPPTLRGVEPPRIFRVMFPEHATALWEQRIPGGELERSLALISPDKQKARRMRLEFNKFLTLQLFLCTLGAESPQRDIVGQWLRREPRQLEELLCRFLRENRKRQRNELLRKRLNLVRTALSLSSTPEAAALSDALSQAFPEVYEGLPSHNPAETLSEQEFNQSIEILGRFMHTHAEPSLLALGKNFGAELFSALMTTELSGEWTRFVEEDEGWPAWLVHYHPPF